MNLVLLLVSIVSKANTFSLPLTAPVAEGWGDAVVAPPAAAAALEQPPAAAPAPTGWEL